jgi:ATP-dependent Zn protease
MTAGVAAQHVVDEQGALNSAVADKQRAAECIERVGLNQQQPDELIIEAAKAAANIVMKNIATARTIADPLEQKKRIEGDEIRDIVRRQNEAAIRS